MNENIPGRRDSAPRNIRPPIAEVFRQTANSLANDFYVPEYRFIEYLISKKLLLRQTRDVPHDLFASLANVVKIE